MAVDQFLSAGRQITRNQLQVRGIATGTEILTGNLQLTARSAQLLRLDPGGGPRDVLLPGAAQDVADADGLFFWISNAGDAAENLVIQQPSGSTLVTVNQNEAVLVCGTGRQTYSHFGVVAVAQT